MNALDLWVLDRLKKARFPNTSLWDKLLEIYLLTRMALKGRFPYEKGYLSWLRWHILQNIFKTYKLTLFVFEFRERHGLLRKERDTTNAPYQCFFCSRKTFDPGYREMVDGRILVTPPTCWQSECLDAGFARRSQERQEIESLVHPAPEEA